MKTQIASLVLTCILLAFGGEATAQAAVPSGTPVTQAAPLSALMTTSGPLKLTGANATRSLSIPLSGRETLRNAQLHLEGTNSVSLLAERSQLAVRLNGQIVAQLPLSPGRPEFSVDIRLPAQLFKPGYNDLSFAVAQHYTQQCEDPAAPELWTEINSVRSTLALDAELKPVAPLLSSLDDIFDPKLRTPPNVAILTPAGISLDQERLAWGSLVAQGVGLRMRYLPARMQHVLARAVSGSGRISETMGADVIPGSDAILIGLANELRPMLPSPIANAIGGSFIGIYPQQADNHRAIIVISGTTAAEVRRAAQAFAELRFPFPRQNSMIVENLEPAHLKPYSANGRLVEPGIYLLRDLGFSSRSVSSMGAESIDLDLSLPPDYYVAENTMIEFDLNFAYGAKMRQDSVLNIKLNGRFEQAITLDQERGGFFHHYRIALPARNFLPGQNHISFEPHMMPLVSGNCILLQNENLQLSIRDDSTIRLPKIFHFTQLPDLNRFARSGFPFTVENRGEALSVLLTGTDSATVGAAWTLMSKLAQKRGLVMSDVEISTDKPSANRHLLIIGAQATIPVTLQAGAPWQMGKSLQVSYPLLTGNAVPQQSISLLQRWHDWIFGELNTRESTLDTEATRMKQISGLNDQLLVMQYRSPSSGDRSVITFTAHSPALLQTGINAITQPEYWETLGGDVALYTPGESVLATQQAGPRYTQGQIGVFDRLAFYYEHRPWLWILLTVLTIGLLAILTNKLLNRYRARTHAGVEDETK